MGRLHMNMKQGGGDGKVEVQFFVCFFVVVFS